MLPGELKDIISSQMKGETTDSAANHHQIFSLHDEDFGLCDRLAQPIPSMTDKPVSIARGSEKMFGYMVERRHYLSF